MKVPEFITTKLIHRARLLDNGAALGGSSRPTRPPSRFINGSRWVKPEMIERGNESRPQFPAEMTISSLGSRRSIIAASEAVIPDLGFPTSGRGAAAKQRGTFRSALSSWPVEGEGGW